MSIDTSTAAKVAKLARIAVDDAALPALTEEVSPILGFIEHLNEVDVDGVTLPFHCIAIADGSRNIEVGAEVTVSSTRRFGRLEASRVSRRAG